MPWPISAGMLGMARTMRSVPSQRAMLALGMPAATLRCSAARTCGATGWAASRKTWGLTAQITRSACASVVAAASASGLASMPQRCLSAARAASKGSTTVS